MDKAAKEFLNQQFYLAPADIDTWYDELHLKLVSKQRSNEIAEASSHCIAQSKIL